MPANKMKTTSPFYNLASKDSIYFTFSWLQLITKLFQIQENIIKINLLRGELWKSHYRKACGMVGFFTIKKEKNSVTVCYLETGHIIFVCKISSFFPLRSSVSVYYNSSKTMCPNTCTAVSTAALFTVPKIWKQPKCPLTEDE